MTETVRRLEERLARLEGRVPMDVSLVERREMLDRDRNGGMMSISDAPPTYRE